jgi:hypothetical protein
VCRVCDSEFDSWSVGRGVIYTHEGLFSLPLPGLNKNGVFHLRYQEKVSVYRDVDIHCII